MVLLVEATSATADRGENEPGQHFSGRYGDEKYQVRTLGGSKFGSARFTVVQIMIRKTRFYLFIR